MPKYIRNNKGFIQLNMKINIEPKNNKRIRKHPIYLDEDFMKINDFMYSNKNSMII